MNMTLAIAKKRRARLRARLMKTWGLEAEPRSQGDHTASQGSLCLTEARIICSCYGIPYIVGNACWIEVKIVEDVVRVEPELDPAVFTEYRHIRKAKCL